MFLYALDLIGTAVFAITGVLVAFRRNMDWFGVFVLAFVTAVGGGTIRDMLLGGDAVFWITDTNYLYIIFASTIAGLMMLKFSMGFKNTLLILDALGLATFMVLGVEKTLNFGAEPVVAIMMGVLTGVGGGAIRDVLAGEIPLVLREGIYATAALVGGIVYVCLNSIGLPLEWVALSSAAVVFSLRLAGINRNLMLPSWGTTDKI